MSNLRSKMPARKSIYAFWVPVLMRMGLEIDDELLANNACFACARTAPLHRAHIKPLAAGGSNNVRNLHVLCASCHAESEFFSGKGYWVWFRQKRTSSGFYSPLRALMAVIDADPKLRAYLESITQPRGTKT